MRFKTGVKNIILICFYLTVWQIAAGNIPLFSILNETGAKLEWEPNYNMGKLIKGNLWIRFMPEAAFIYLGRENELISAEIHVSDSGSIEFSQRTADSVINYFNQNVSQPDLPNMHIAYILIDPGHGGRDPGAIGTRIEDGREEDIKEKNVVLNVSLKIAELLKASHPDISVLLTRNDDTYLDLDSRTGLANSIALKDDEAIIFISIHANASLSDTAKGFEIWYLPPDYERELIRQEDIPEEDHDIINILNQMMEVEYLTESIILAKSVSEGLDGTVGSETNNRGLKQEKWFVVRKSKMPSILIELGFVTNPAEAVKLNDSAYLLKLSQGIYNGVIQFIQIFNTTKGFTKMEPVQE